MGSAADLVATCLWRVDEALVVILDRRFGEPVDAYVNGSQVWLRDDGPGGVTIEWRLHPVAGFARPAGISISDLFPAVALALAEGQPPPAPLPALWDGLEAFAAFGDEVEPAPLAAAALAALGRIPDASGLVDHETIASEWERTGRGISITAGLLEQLAV